MKTIAVADFAARLCEGAHAFDTRPLAQYEKDALPGAHHLSLEKVQAGGLPDLSLGDPIYLICERGLMSDLIALYLEAAGFSEVYNVEGGMVAWRRLQLEVAEPQASTEHQASTGSQASKPQNSE